MTLFAVLLLARLHLFEVSGCLNIVNHGLEGEILSHWLLRLLFAILGCLLHTIRHFGPCEAFVSSVVDANLSLLFFDSHLLSISADGG